MNKFKSVILTIVCFAIAGSCFLLGCEQQCKENCGGHSSANVAGSGGSGGNSGESGSAGADNTAPATSSSVK